MTESTAAETVPTIRRGFDDAGKWMTTTRIPAQISDSHLRVWALVMRISVREEVPAIDPPLALSLGGCAGHRPEF